MQDNNGIKIVVASTSDGKSEWAPGDYEQQQARTKRDVPQYLSRVPRLRPNVRKALRDEKL